MSPGKRRDPPIVLPGRRTPDALVWAAKAAAERGRGRPAHARDPARKAGRQRVKDVAMSRLGLEVGKMVRQSLIRRVQRGDVKYARKLTHSRTVIVLDCAEGEMAFLYSSTTKEIVCFLPADAPEIADWRRARAAAPGLLRRGRDGAQR